MAETMRERVVAVLSAAMIDEAKETARIFEGRDPRGEAILRRLIDAAERLRDLFANGGREPLDPLAAEDLMNLARAFESESAKCADTQLSEAVAFRGKWLSSWVINQDTEVDGDVRYRFRHT